MPTFSTMELENLLEPQVRDSYTKPLLSSCAIQGREISVFEPLPAPRHIYISSALYTTPEQAPISDTTSEPLSPSPYVVNHKRRGGRVGVVGNQSGGGGFEIPAEEEEGEKGGELVVVEEEEEEQAREVVQDNFGGGAEEELFGEEEDGLLDSRCESGSLGSRNEVPRQFDCRSFASNQGEFFDAIEVNGETPWFFVAVMATAMEVACAAGILILKGKYKGFIGFSFVISAYCYFGLLLYCFVIHRHVPQKCLGNLGKLMFDLIATSAAMALCQILGFDIFSLLLLVGFTVNLHVVAQSLHRAYDVSMWDVLFGSIMQIVVYTLWQDKYMVTVVLMLFYGVLFYRYASYSPPVMPVDMKQSDKQLC